jgi:hypothetical protein
MNVFRFIGAIFLLGSVLLLGAGGYAYHHTKKFLENSVVAKGTVVDLAPRSSSSSSGRTYAPVVRFKTDRGETITAHGSLASSPPSYKRGEEVRVRYDPKNPHDISIDSFFELWFLPLILLGIGTVFGMVGAPMVLASVFSARKIRWLRENGQVIMTEYQSVVVNQSERSGGQHPYQIVSQWLDPTTNKVYVFRSRNLYFNPEKYIQTSQIPVRIDPQNPKKYWMDTSFLPEGAG